MLGLASHRATGLGLRQLIVGVLFIVSSAFRTLRTCKELRIIDLIFMR